MGSPPVVDMVPVGALPRRQNERKEETPSSLFMSDPGETVNLKDTVLKVDRTVLTSPSFIILSVSLISVDKETGLCCPFNTLTLVSTIPLVLIIVDNFFALVQYKYGG